MKAKTGAARPTLKKKVSAKNSKDSLEEIFDDLLKDIYWAEKHLLKALPKMAKASYNVELRQAFETHLQETQHQVERLEQCFEIMEKKPTAKKCEAMEGLVQEGAEAIEDYAEGHARDAALIAAAQKVEHYEISAYGTMRTMANVLGRVQCAELLDETKDEESDTDEKLTSLAERINQFATEVEAV